MLCLGIHELRTVLNGFHEEVNVNQSLIKNQMVEDTGTTPFL